ncbi:hypothetical protein [Glaciihabitans sp. UYNi722]|uniref:membrane protein YczE n=1 Tax=Glaciihabitans sp. UYNi722 TaxID=3156344 RepID=UPI003393ACFF
MTAPLVMTRRIAQLLVGLFLYGIAIAMMVQAQVGVSPWDVLSQGVARLTGIQFGWVTNIIGLAVLLLWIPLRQRPGVGTLLNVLLVGPSAQLGLTILPQPDQLWARILLFAGGLALLAIATGLYIGARFGPGPRDGLMTGIHRRWGWRIWIVRTSIEVVVLGIGWLLGGNVGFGTLAFALLVGPMVNLTMPFLRVPELPPRNRVVEGDAETSADAASTPLEIGESS